MRRRVLLLVAATTSAVVLAFVIPLCLLVRTLAADRAVAEADQEARNVAVLVSSLHDSAQLGDAVAAADERSAARTSVTMSSGLRLGSSEPAANPSEADLERARAGSAFTSRGEAGTLIVVPVVTETGTEVVSTWVPVAELYRGVTQAWLLIAALGVLLTALALAIADQLGRRVSTPVTRVARIADRLREGDLAARAVPEGPPETKALATALNLLAERIEELLRLERTAVADLSHRLRTPVTALRIDVDRVGDEALAERLRRHVGNLQRSVDAIIKDARRPVRHGMEVGCNAVPVVRTGVEFWAPLAEDEGRRLEVDLPERGLAVDMDAVDLRDVLDILVDNVFAHTLEGSPFAVRLHRESSAGRDPAAVLRVESGAVKAPENSSGQVGASTEAAGSRGTGLGLQIARRALASRGGELQVDFTTTGTAVTARIPLGTRR